MRTTPKGKHEKRLPFWGCPVKKHELERQQAEFFRILCGKHEIVRLRTENHSTESDFSFGADMKTHIRKSKSRVASRPFLPAFSAHGKIICPCPADKDTATSCTWKVPFDLHGTVRHAAERTAGPTQMAGTTTFFLSFWIRQKPRESHKIFGGLSCPHTRDSHGVGFDILTIWQNEWWDKTKEQKDISFLHAQPFVLLSLCQFLPG